jgi:ABC-type branched-subunit amino acid transport system permease subunit
MAQVGNAPVARGTSRPRAGLGSGDALPIGALIRIGLWTGLFGILIIILWSGSSAIMSGLLAGVICGFVASGRATQETPGSGARAAIVAAVVAGLMIIAGQALRYYGLEVQGYVRNGRVASSAIAFRAAGLGFICAVGLAALLGYARYLQGRMSRTLTVGTLAILIALFPFIDRQINLLWINTLIPILVFTLLALGLNIVVGYAGLLDLGYAAFFAIGAYTAGLLSSSHLGGQFGYTYQMNFWVVIWVAAVVAAIFGLILGAPTLPLRGDYLAIVTLGFGEIVPIVFRNLTAWEISIPFTNTVLIGEGGIIANLDKPLNVTNGEFGINPIQQPNLQLIDMPSLLGGQLTGSQTLGAIVGLAIFAAIALVATMFLVRTVQVQLLNRAAWYVRAGTGVATALALGVITFIFFGQYYSWVIASLLLAFGILGLLLSAMRSRELVPAVGAFTATLLVLVGVFITATESPNQLSFANPSQRWMWYYLIVGLMLLSAFFINRLRRSRIGRAWMAMREDELAAAAMGIDIVRTKLLAFSMGATFSGFAGAYFAAYIQAIFPSTFDFSVSVIVLCMVILGGMGNMVGVVIGGLIIMSADRLFLPQISSFIQDLSGTTQQPFFNNLDVSLYRLALFGLVLVIMMQVRPEGLVPNLRRKMELTADEETIERENSALYDAERDPQLAAE